MTDVVIYHNPRCSKSRETLQLLQQRGLAPTVIEYLKTPPDRAELTSLLAKLGMRARDIARTDDPQFKALQLEDGDAGDAQLIEAMAAHPQMIQRPIVVVGDRAALGRPPEAVLALLDH